MKYFVIICILLIELFARSNVAYKKAEIRHKSQINGGYSHNGKVKYQYIEGRIRTNSNHIDVASTKGQNSQRKIENNVYGNSVSVVGRSGYSNRYRDSSSVATVNLNTRKNKRVNKVETYINNVKIIKGR